KVNDVEHSLTRRRVDVGLACAAEVSGIRRAQRHHALLAPEDANFRANQAAPELECRLTADPAKPQLGAVVRIAWNVVGGYSAPQGVERWPVVTSRVVGGEKPVTRWCPFHANVGQPNGFVEVVRVVPLSSFCGQLVQPRLA